MTACTACRGTGKVYAHINTRDPRTHGFQWTRCLDCGGIGTLTSDEVHMREEGANVRAARMRYGVGLRQAAELLGLTAVEMSDVERGKRQAPISWLYMISNGAEQ